MDEYELIEKIEQLMEMDNIRSFSDLLDSLTLAELEILKEIVKLGISAKKSTF